MDIEQFKTEAQFFFNTIGIKPDQFQSQARCYGFKAVARPRKNTTITIEWWNNAAVNRWQVQEESRILHLSASGSTLKEAWSRRASYV